MKRIVKIALTLLVLTINLFTQEEVIPLYVEPNWQVVPPHPDYPTDDVVLSTLSITDTRFKNRLPATPGITDCTATFQEAIDQVYAAGGGTVFVPAGEYLFRGKLTVRSRVTLRGQWQFPKAVGWKAGTVFKIATKGATKDDAFLTLASRTGLQEINFWYPEQKPNALQSYPFTVKAHSGANTVQNITFVNSVHALDAQNSAMSVFRGIYGTAIGTGMIAGRGVAFPRFEVICFSPLYWEWWPLDDVKANVENKNNYANYMMNKGVGVRLREMDGCNWFHGEISGYSVGLVTEDNAGTAEVEGDAPHGNGFKVNITNCITGMVIRRGGMTWHDSEFSGIEYGITSTEFGSADIHESKISGGKAAISFSDTSATALGVKNSKLNGKIVALGKNTFDFYDNDFFITSGSALNLSTDVKGVFSGCRQDGNNLIKGEAKVRVLNKRIAHEPFPEYKIDYRTDWNRDRKPLKNDLFNVKDTKFSGGAKGDGKSDDSKALRAAITAAKANGGGIVFFPTGYYRLTENFDVGVGIEIRGAAGTRYHAGAGLTDATPNLLSVIVIETEGTAEGTPLFTLGDKSGVRGLLFFYPSLNWKSLMDLKEPFKPFPFTISGRGKGNYVINCTSPNPYQFAEFRGAEDFLVEYCLIGGIRKAFQVIDSKNGRLQCSHIKPSGFMGGLSDVRNVVEYREGYGYESAKLLEAFVLRNSENIMLSGIFARTANRVLTLDNSTGLALLIGGEHLQNGFVFEKEGSKPFIMIDCGHNAGRHGDEKGKVGITLMPSFNGKVIVHGGHMAGTADITFKVMSGELEVHNITTPNFGYRSSRAIVVGPNGKLNMTHSEMSRAFALQIAKGGVANFNFCNFPGGFPSGIQEGTLTVTDSSQSGKSIISVPGQQMFMEQGLKMSREGTKKVMEDRSWAIQLTSAQSFVYDVIDPEFMGDKISKVSLEFSIYVAATTQVTLVYDSKSGLKTVVKNINKKGYNTVKFILNDANFLSDKKDFEISFDKPNNVLKPMLTEVIITK